MAGYALTRFGGEVPRVPERTLEPRAAAAALDVDLSRGTLAPFRTDRLVSTVGQNAKTLMIEDCCEIRYSTCADIARRTLPCLRYWRTGVNGYLETTDEPCGAWVRSGFPCIDRAPAVSFINQSRTEQKVGVRRYLYTLVDAWGNESAGSPPSDPVVCDWDNQALISGFQIPPAPYAPKLIRVYSTAPDIGTQDSPQGSLDSFFLVGEVAVGTASVFNDPSTDGYGKAYDSETYMEAPEDLTNVQSWGTNQIAGLAGGMLYFSHADRPDSFPRSYAMAFHDGALRWLATSRYGYVLTCGRPEVVDITVDCKGGSCRGATTIQTKLPLMGLRSVARWDDACIYASREGLIALEGTRAVNLTRELFAPAQWEALQPQTVIGVVHDGYYFWTCAGGTFRLKLPGNLFDPLPDTALMPLSIRPTAWYVSAASRLFFADAQGIKEWNRGDDLKPYLWRSGTIRVSDAPILAAAKLDMECGRSVQFRFLDTSKGCAGRARVDRRVDSDVAFRLPTGVRGTFHQIEIAGRAEVQRVRLSDSLAGLTRI